MVSIGPNFLIVHVNKLNNVLEPKLPNGKQRAYLSSVGFWKILDVLTGNMAVPMISTKLSSKQLSRMAVVIVVRRNYA
jgi:tellurite resistance-related uncharacterized protein